MPEGLRRFLLGRNARRAHPRPARAATVDPRSRSPSASRSIPSSPTTTPHAWSSMTRRSSCCRARAAPRSTRWW